MVGVGAVGSEMLRVLRQHKFPIGKLKVLARSARKINVDGYEYNVEKISFIKTTKVRFCWKLMEEKTQQGEVDP